MEAILARRFDPFYFSYVPIFPNVVPTMDEWGDFFPTFKEHRNDNPAEHLLEFHELMHQWGIHHEDVLRKMFMYSLEGDARKWYQSLPPASISSLEQFHVAFNMHCQNFYSSELICHSCCEEYKNYVQDIDDSYEGCENEEYALDEESVFSLPCSSTSDENCVCCLSKEKKLSLFWKLMFFVALPLKSLDISSLLLTNMTMMRYFFLD
jgi:hypothetical protein